SSRDSVSSRIVRITRPRPNDTSSTVVDGVGENNTVGTGNRDGSASRADHGTTNTAPPGYLPPATSMSVRGRSTSHRPLEPTRQSSGTGTRTGSSATGSPPGRQNHS